MKKITLLLVWLFGLPLFAQRHLPEQVQHLVDMNKNFHPVSPLIPLDIHNGVDAHLRTATLARLNMDVVDEIAKEKYDALELTIPYDGDEITMQLYGITLFASDFHVDSDKRHDIPYVPGAYYRGIIKGVPNSVAAFSFFKGELYGVVSSPAHGNVVVGRMQAAGNQGDYIIYSDTDMQATHDFECLFTDKGKFPENNIQKTTFGTQSEHCVSLYFELQHNFFLYNASDIGQTTNWFTAMFNNVQALYANDGITIALKNLYIWTEEDPYSFSSSSAYDLLSQFAEHRPVFDGDLGQLLMYGGPNGLGSIAGLCSNHNISYSPVTLYYEQIPVYSWTIEVIAHELGHLMGSYHTHGCYWNGNNTAIDGCMSPEGDCPQGPVPGTEGGTIMSYCGNINFANGFGPQPAQRMLDHIAASECLGTDCINSCMNTISSIDLEDTTTSSASISWSDSEPGPWEIGYAPLGEEITNWQQTDQNIIIIEGLQANAYYTFSAHNLCSGGISPGNRYLSFSTGADWCSGALWTDTGGANGDYQENQHTVTIIKPQNPGQAVAVSFDNFFTQYDLDIMYIYDGIGTDAPLLGSWMGYTPPATSYQAANADGALTFEFVSSEGSIPSPGWVASVQCLLATETHAFNQLSYYPNPVNQHLTINNPSGITEIRLYNVTGQLLCSNNIDSTTAVIDMSRYPQGVYIITIENEEQNNNFKVIKE